MGISRRALFVTGLICCTTIVSHSFGRSTFGLLLPAIEDDLGLSHARAGLPSTGIYVAYVIGVLMVTAAAPRLEPITIMRIGIGSAAVGLITAAMAPNLAVLTFGVALAGGSGAGIWLTAPVLATAHVPPARHGVVIGLLSSSIGLANIMLGLGTTGLREATGNDELWRPVFAIESLLTIGLLTLIVALARFQRTEKISGGFSIELLRSVPSWGRTTAAYACFGSMSAGFGSFMLVAMEEQGNLSRGTTTLVFSAMGIAGVFFAPMLGGASDRMGRRRLMTVSMATLTLANLVVALGTGWLVAGGVMLFGAAAGSFPALVATHVRDHVDGRSFSRVMATMTISFSLIAAITPTTVGWLADATDGFRIPYLLLSALAGTSLFLVATMPDPTPSERKKVPSGP